MPPATIKSLIGLITLFHAWIVRLASPRVKAAFAPMNARTTYTRFFVIVGRKATVRPEAQPSTPWSEPSLAYAFLVVVLARLQAQYCAR